MSPIKGKVRISAKFAVKDALHPKGHSGIDIAIPRATPLFCPADGIATVWQNDHGGIQCKIKHTNGFTTGYAHLAGTLVSNGQKVRQGEVFAYSGNTGKHTTGAHLHFTLRDPSGNLIDPLTQFSFKG